MPELLAFLLVIFGAAIGYAARWLQDRRAHKIQLKEQDLDVIEDWLGHFTGCMTALERLIQDFVEEQLERAGKSPGESETRQTMDAYAAMYNVHRGHMEKMAPKVASLEPRFPDLYTELRQLNAIFKEVHAGFVIPWQQFDSDMEQLPDDTTTADYLRTVEPHRRPLTDGVKIAKSHFAQLFPKLADMYARVRSLR